MSRLCQAIFLIVASMLFMLPVEAGSTRFSYNAPQKLDSGVEIKADKVCLSLPSDYHKNAEKPCFYRFSVLLTVNALDGRSRLVEWEHTIFGAGPSEFTVQKKGASSPLAREPFPLGSNCSKCSQKLMRRKPVQLLCSSSAYYIDDLDAEYEVVLSGRLKINGQWKNYSFRWVVIPRQYID